MYSHEYNKTPKLNFHTFQTGILFSRPCQSIELQQISKYEIASQEEHELYLSILQILSKQQGTKVFQYSEPEHIIFANILDELNTQTQLTGEIGVAKFQQVMETIIHHTDHYGRTSDVHKVLYLLFRYLEIQAKKRQRMFWTVGNVHRNHTLISEKQNNNYNNKRDNSKSKKLESGYEGMAVEWLIDAASLFSVQLESQPILLNYSPSKNSAQKSQKPRNSRESQTQKKAPESEPLPNSSLKSQRFGLFLTLLEQNKLHNLIQQLQQLYKTINQQYRQQNLLTMFQSVDEQTYNQYGAEAYKSSIQQRRQSWQSVRNALLSTISNILKMLSYRTQCSPHSVWKSTVCQPLQPSQFSVFFSGHKQLFNILKCMTGILLGNVKVIQQYCGHNIYRYLSMLILYADMTEDLGAGFANVDIRKFVYSYLQNKYNTPINSTQSQKKGHTLKHTHQYLLSLFYMLTPYSHSPKRHPHPSGSQPTRWPVPPPPQLQLHNFFQETIAFFINHQFYAYLIISIIFNMGAVNRQLYLMDEEYQINVHMELFMSASASVTARNLMQHKNAHRQEEQRGREQQDGGLSYIQEEEDDKDDSLELSQDSLQYSIIKQPLLLNNPSHKPASTKSGGLVSAAHRNRRCELLLACFSFYRNILMRSSEQKKLKHQFQLDFQTERIRKLVTYDPPKYPYNEEQIQNNILMLTKQYEIGSRIAFYKLPLFQVADRLARQVFGFQDTHKEEFVNWVRAIAQAAVNGDAADYFGIYFRDLLASVIRKNGSNCLPNQHILDLMSLQLQLCLLSSYPYNPSPHLELQSPSIYSTYTFSLLHSDYLTQCTLIQPFNYNILNKVDELTNSKSILFGLSQEIAHEFYICFQIYAELADITKRGHQIYQIDQIIDSEEEKEQAKEENKEDKKEANRMGKNKFNRKNMRNTLHLKKYNYHNLKKCIVKFDKLLNILYRHLNQACGEIVRISWQVLEDYQLLKSEYKSTFEMGSEQKVLLEELADKVLTFFKQLRLYITSMENEGYITEELNRFKKLIF